ncbi:hypothetical protein SNA45_00305, partial [Escherichia coli]|nr:hypothetical protein [Escherichia coli]MDZ9123347.1 hypothetical protein [Escherichia coli]
AFEWVHVQLHQQKGMISLSPPTICNSAKQPTLEVLMRQNLPVTGRNLELPKDANILSTTSPQSHITYVNPDFIKISGFTEEEL